MFRSYLDIRYPNTVITESKEKSAPYKRPITSCPENPSHFEMTSKMAGIQLTVLLLMAASGALAQGNYLIGRGIADCTGPVAEINMVNIKWVL